MVSLALNHSCKLPFTQDIPAIGGKEHMNKMERKCLIAVFGVVFSLFFLQISCAGLTEHLDEDASAAIEVAPEEVGLLIGTHKSAGVSCGDCHSESPSAGEISEATCLACHEDYMDLTADMYEDPHNAHIAFPDCVSCHHVHQQSENQCLACHAF